MEDGAFIDALHEQARAFMAARRAGRAVSFDVASAFIGRLRSQASTAALVRRFETSAEFEAGAFRRMVIDTEVQLEKMMARAYIAGQADGIEPEMRDGYPMARKEAQALGLGGEAWLHFVGCGAAPLTAMRYHDLCAARVVCIDRDAEALQLADRMLVQRYGAGAVAANFRFVHSAAESLQLAAGSVAHLLLAAHCRHKEALLRALAPSLAEGCRVLVRLPMGLYHHVYDRVDFDRCPEYRVAQTVDDAAEPFCCAALLTLARATEPSARAADRTSSAHA
jgi:hypothetical protein